MSEINEPSLKNIEVEVDEKKIELAEIAPIDPEKVIPLMSDPDWSEYVMKQFEEDEMMDGNPTVDGLRRVTHKLIGKIVSSRCNVVSAPIPNNDWSATVEHEVVIKSDEGLLSFRETADVTIMNCEPEFRRFATSTASTRAEARALRKALMLRKVIAAEEVTVVPPETADNPGKIVQSQITFITQLCKRNDINMNKYINMGTHKYANISDVPYSVAVKMVGVLSDLQRNPDKIKDSIKGWDENWNKK
jgi:hypothetical protein